jgi:hypothetical protein
LHFKQLRYNNANAGGQPHRRRCVCIKQTLIAFALVMVLGATYWRWLG